MRYRIPRFLWIAAILVMAAFYFHHVSFEGDTTSLISGTRAAMRCATERRWGHCPEADTFPLLQRIPAGIMIASGMKDGLVIRLLTMLNLALSISGGYLLFRKLKLRSESLAWIGVCAVLASPIPWYLRSSFSEVLAAVVTVGLVSLCSERKSAGLIALFAFLAALSKETALPFVAFLIWLSARNTERFPAPFGSRRFLAAGCGLLSALLAHITFNFFRFGSWWNVSYLDATLITPTWRDQMSFLFGLWLSPQGGWLIFFPAITALLIWIGSRALKREVPAMTLIGSIALIGGLTFGFSKWYSPFGWNAWGPRFLIPWMPAVLLLLLTSYEKLLLENSTRIRAWIPAIGIAAFPQFVVLFGNEIYERLFYSFGGDPICPKAPVIQEDSAYYYRCLHHMIWPNSLGSWSAGGAFNFWAMPGAFTLGALALVAWIGLSRRIGAKEPEFERPRPEPSPIRA